MKKIIYLLIAFTLHLQAQTPDLEAVNIAMLSEKKCTIDTNAVASILFCKALTNFKFKENDSRFVVEHQYHYRIKIYKKEGFNWANFKKDYYIGSNLSEAESVHFFDAYTYNLENGKIVKTKLSNEGKFKQSKNTNWGEAIITMPNVKEGSIVEFKYVLKSQNLLTFPEFEIQHEIPVYYAAYHTEIPEYYIYKPILKGKIEVKVTSNLETANQSGQNQYGNTTHISFKHIVSNYEAWQVPAIVDEPFVDNLDNYKSGIKHEIERVRLPGQEIKDYSKTWEGVAKTIYEDKDFGKEIKERKYIEKNLKEIIKLDTSQIQKMHTIYKFIQKRMNWNHHYGIFSEKGVKKAFDEQTGNVAEIHFILNAMLNHAGIQSYPVLLSTKSHGVPVFPSRTVFNYVIIAAEIDGNRILLDATNPNNCPNILPIETLNWTGRLVKNDGISEEIQLIPEKLSKLQTFVIAKIENSGKVLGQTKIIRTDYQALQFRTSKKEVQPQLYLEELEKEFHDIQINNYKEENLKDDLSKPVIEKFQFETQNLIEMIGNKIYINPLIFVALQGNPLKAETRKNPICFEYPLEKKAAISIEIPYGYQVESMPITKNLAIEGNLAHYQFQIQKADNIIQVSSNLQMNQCVISEIYYNDLKTFFQQVNELENQKIVLKKI
ncbi:DUF3857 domain-containing protein [Flavobacterium branchiophilum]|uniref:DUF3857 domain-containing protein n=1 Tax=Flavobacterium branchiophilum TaxID=55197 RepID=UPI00117ABB89|nr:DUF3857 domain-containing protein [Flavobacterium branchiophilum]